MTYSKEAATQRARNFRCRKSLTNTKYPDLPQIHIYWIVYCVYCIISIKFLLHIWLVLWSRVTYICDPLCEIQTKVSESNYEITSIKVRFLPLISLQFQSLTWPYLVNIKDIKVTISKSVLFHMKDDFFEENSKSVFTERVTYIERGEITFLQISVQWTRPQLVCLTHGDSACSCSGQSLNSCFRWKRHNVVSRTYQPCRTTTVR